MVSHRPAFRRIVIAALVALACAIWAGAAYGVAAPDIGPWPFGGFFPLPTGVASLI